MKYIKLFENETDEKKERLYSELCWYLEDIQPISDEDGFKECLYDDGEAFELSFYFKPATDEEEYEKFYNFLEEHGLDIFDEEMRKAYNEHNKTYYTTVYEIIVRPNEEQLKKLLDDSEMWNTVKKYNL